MKTVFKKVETEKNKTKTKHTKNQKVEMESQEDGRYVDPKLGG